MSGAPVAWVEVAIDRRHNRNEFDCGVPELNDWLRRYARQNHESGGAKTFVATPARDSVDVLGFYSIAPGSIGFENAPQTITKKLGRYDVPVFRLGRLAVAKSMQGRGLGADLLLAAAARALAVASSAGGVGLAIDAKDAAAAEWYGRFGAMRLRDDPLKLILPFATIATALETFNKR